MTNRDDWDVELRPHRTPIFAYAAAFIIAAVHIAVGFLLKAGSTGVVFQTTTRWRWRSWVWSLPA